MHRLPTTAFLDRDAVINRKMPTGSYVETWEQFEFLPARSRLCRCWLRPDPGGGRNEPEGRGARPNDHGERGRDPSQDAARLAEEGARCAAILVCRTTTARATAASRLGMFRQAQALMPRSISARGRSRRLGIRSLGRQQAWLPVIPGRDEARLAAVLAERPDLAVAGRATSLLELVSRCLGSNSAG